MYFYRRNIMEAQNDDILLLKLIKQDDQLAFKQVFYKYIDPLSHFVNFYIHDWDATEELVMDLFSFIWENRTTLEIKITLKAYLFQAAKNKAFTHKRDKKETVAIDDVSGQLFSTEDWQVEFDELTRLVEEAVSLLPEKCREIFSRSRDKNLTNREIAEELGISVKTVEGQITIALKKIKAFLGDKYAYLW